MQNGSLQKYFRSEITAMSPYKPGEQPQTGKSIKLNTNENPKPPTPQGQVAKGSASDRCCKFQAGAIS
jgi:histidinol-phosphate/aromatic aminotransferase/cobyric acid decarboxylase-like protein